MIYNISLRDDLKYSYDIFFVFNFTFPCHILTAILTYLRKNVQSMLHTNGVKGIKLTIVIRLRTYVRLEIRVGTQLIVKYEAVVCTQP